MHVGDPHEHLVAKAREHAIGEAQIDAQIRGLRIAVVAPLEVAAGDHLRAGCARARVDELDRHDLLEGRLAIGLEAQVQLGGSGRERGHVDLALGQARTDLRERTQRVRHALRIDELGPDHELAVEGPQVAAEHLGAQCESLPRLPARVDLDIDRVEDPTARAPHAEHDRASEADRAGDDQRPVQARRLVLERGLARDASGVDPIGRA